MGSFFSMQLTKQPPFEVASLIFKDFKIQIPKSKYAYVSQLNLAIPQYIHIFKQQC